MNKLTQKALGQLKKLCKGDFVHWSLPSTAQAEIKPDREIIQELLKPEHNLFSVLIYSDNDISYKTRKNKKFFNSKKVILPSEFDRRTGSELLRHNNQLGQEVEAELKALKIEKEEDRYFKTFDKIMGKKIEKIKKDLYIELIRESLNYYLEDKNPQLFKTINNDRFNDEQINKQLDSYLNSNSKLKRKIIKDLTVRPPSLEFSRTYSHQLPKNLAKVEAYLGWTQIYCDQDLKTGEVKMIRANARGSGTRESHGEFGHLFAEIQNAGKLIPTFIVYFDNKCQMSINQSPQLVLNRFELTGNYRIDKDLSNKILNGIVLADQDRE